MRGIVTRESCSDDQRARIAVAAEVSCIAGTRDPARQLHKSRQPATACHVGRMWLCRQLTDRFSGTHGIRITSGERTMSQLGFT